MTDVFRAGIWTKDGSVSPSIPSAQIIGATGPTGPTGATGSTGPTGPTVVINEAGCMQKVPPTKSSRDVSSSPKPGT